MREKKKIKKGISPSMNPFQTCSIAKSMHKTFTKILIIFLVAIGLLIGVIMSADSKIKAIGQQYIPNLQAASKATEENLVVQNALYKVCLATDKAAKEQYTSEQNQADVLLQKQLKAMQKSHPSYKAKISEIQTILQEALTYRSQAVLYSIQGKNNEAILLLEQEYFERMEQVNQNLQAIYNMTEAMINEQIASYRKQMIVFIGILLVIILILGIRMRQLAKEMIKAIHGPIIEIEKVMSDMAAGNLETALTYEANNELGGLADKVRDMKQELQGYISNIATVLGDLASKQYDTELTMAYKGTFMPIQDSLAHIIEVLNEVIYSIQKASSHIAIKAEEIHTVSSQLSSGSVEQSASVQELLSMMSDISQQGDENAKSMQIVSENADQMAEQLEGANSCMSSLNEKMGEMEKASDEIKKIVVAIERISRQTHLLALNATIEAARAGEEGRGFSVLGKEISDLSEETREAVSMTKHLLANNVEMINEATQVSKEVSHVLKDANTFIREITARAQEVTSASYQEANALQNFNDSIEAINRVIEGNTQLAIQTEAAGESLLTQTKQLMLEIQSFHLKEKISKSN